jgi:hypothetical protein
MICKVHSQYGYEEVKTDKFLICVRRGKTRPKSPGKFRRKKGKFNFILLFFFSKDAPRTHFIHPKVQKYIEKCRKIAYNIIKINSIPI